MRIVPAAEIDTLLDFPSLIEALHDAFAGDFQAPVRHHHAVGGAGGAIHLLMPAWTADAPARDAFIGTKIVNVFPDNGAHQLPAVHGAYLLQSGETGVPLAIIDGTRLTHWRTAAASALAARFCARADAAHLLMVGAGALAPFLVRAHAAVRPIARIDVWNRNAAGAQQLAAALRAQDFDAHAVTALEASAREADIVSCATLARQPIVKGAWLKPGAHLDLVGAFSMQMREADDVALQRARIVIDTEAARDEGGDVALGLASGAISREATEITLADLCRGEKRARLSHADITLFKSVGASIEDLAAAILLWRRLA